jgi:type II secretory pathway pseudopilin PulG
MLIESVVATMLVVLLVTGLISGTTAALRAGQAGRNRSQANKYSQEGIEMARNLRNAGWVPFFSRADVAPQVQLWCLAKDNAWPGSPATGIADCDLNIDGMFGRSISFSWDDPRMIVVASVRWNEGSAPHQSQLTTYFTQWR